MLEIILDASQLEVFEACPRKWYYSYIRNLISHQPYRAFDIGSYFHECLRHYYSLLSEHNLITKQCPPLNYTSDKELDISLIWQQIIDFAKSDDLFKKYNILDKEERSFYIKRLITYLNRYEEEDQSIDFIAIEQGFSYLLYEDKDRRYILEGKIDLVGTKSPEGLFVMDHKTQSRKDNRWEFNHQVCNYLNFTKANYFIYNYLGLQDTLPKDGLRRIIYQPASGMLNQWIKEVKITFDQMYNYISKPDKLLEGYDILPIYEAEGFPRRRSACDSSKYGLCQYHKLCSVPDNSTWTEVVQSAYKIKDEVWRPWS